MAVFFQPLRPLVALATAAAFISLNTNFLNAEPVSFSDSVTIDTNVSTPVNNGDGEALVLRLRQQVLRERDVSRLAGFVNELLEINERFKKTTLGIPAYLIPLPSFTIVEGIMKVVNSDQPLALDPTKVIENLSMIPDALTMLGDRLQKRFTGYPVPPAQLNFLWGLLGPLSEKYVSLNFQERLISFNQFVSMVGVQWLVNKYKLEGTYEMNFRGDPARLTLQAIGDGRYIMAYEINFDKRVPIPYSFFTLLYNSVTQELEAQHDGDPFTDASRFYSFKGKVNLIEGKPCFEGAFFGGTRFGGTSGCMAEPFHALPPRPGNAIGSAHFLGRIGPYPVSLLLSHAGPILYSGTMRLLNQNLPTDLIFGRYDARTGEYFLTSGELYNEGWIQMRGQIEHEGKIFRGTYTMGGTGKHYELVLRQAP